MSKIKVNEIEAATGSTVTIPTGQTFTVTDGIPATNLSGTIADARLPTVPVTKGGTGLTSLGTANQVLAVNSGASALEFQNAASGGVLKAVHNYNSTPVNTSSSSYVATNNSVTITPTANDSKIYVCLNGNVAVNSSSTDPWIFCKVQRSIGGGSYTDVISNWYRRYAPSAGSVHLLSDVNFHFIDAPTTTSQIVYKVYFHGGGTSVWFGGRSSNEPSSTNGIAIELANGIA